MDIYLREHSRKGRSSPFTLCFMNNVFLNSGKHTLKNQMENRKMKINVKSRSKEIWNSYKNPKEFGSHIIWNRRHFRFTVIIRPSVDIPKIVPSPPKNQYAIIIIMMVIRIIVIIIICIAVAIVIIGIIIDINSS